MLTDIFAYRYLDQPIWAQYTEVEKRLLNQAFGVVKDALPYYTHDGKENSENKNKWNMLHDRLARELGVDELSQRYYSYITKNGLGQDCPVSGWYSWEHVCSQFVNVTYTGQCDADRFIKERISFVELGLRLRGEEVAQANANLPNSITQAAIQDSKPRYGGITVPGIAVDGVKAWN